MKKLLTAVAIGCAMALPGVVQAEEAATAPGDALSQHNPKQFATPEAASTPASAPAGPNTGALSLSGGADVVSSYWFRGYKQASSGFIGQPYATLSAKVYSSDTLTITPYIGTWNSFHSSHVDSTESSSNNESWFESDLFGGVDVGMGKFTLGTIYTFYTYPSHVFKTVEELGFKVSYDDTDAMKNLGIPFGFKPYAAWYFETDDGNGPNNQYVELGVAPSFALSNTPVTLSVPVAVGLTPNGYYTTSSGSNAPVGYMSVGLLASMPLPVPAKFGAWTLTGCVTYDYLIADSAKESDTGDSSAWIGKIGVSFVY